MEKRTTLSTLPYTDHKSALDVRLYNFYCPFSLWRPQDDEKHNFATFANLILECHIPGPRPKLGECRGRGGRRRQGSTSAGGVMVISDALVGADLSRGALGDVA